jgi:hypothetical protein
VSFLFLSFSFYSQQQQPKKKKKKKKSEFALQLLPFSLLPFFILLPRIDSISTTTTIHSIVDVDDV